MGMYVCWFIPIHSCVITIKTVLKLFFRSTYHKYSINHHTTHLMSDSYCSHVLFTSGGKIRYPLINLWFPSIRNTVIHNRGNSTFTTGTSTNLGRSHRFHHIRTIYIYVKWRHRMTLPSKEVLHGIAILGRSHRLPYVSPTFENSCASSLHIS